MSNVFTLLLARETRLLFRRPAELANPLVFFAIVIALLTGIRLTWQRLLVVLVATVAILGIFGVVDLVRPAEQRGHGVERVVDQGIGLLGPRGGQPVLTPTRGGCRCRRLPMCRRG